MTSHLTNRIRNVAATAKRNSDSLYTSAEHPDLCDPLRAFMVAEAIAWQQFSRIVLGDIGEPEEQEEWEVEPLTIPQPAEVPVPA